MIVPQNMFWSRKDIFILQELYKVWNLTTNGNLRRRHLLLKFRKVIWVIISNVQLTQVMINESLTKTWKIKYWTLARKRPLLLQNLLIASKSPHNSLSRSCCSLLVGINILKHPDVSFSDPTPLSQIQNCHGPLLTLRFWFLSFFKGALLPNFNKIVEREFLTMGVQQLKDTFSTVRTNLRSWLNTVYWIWRRRTWVRNDVSRGITVITLVFNDATE